MIEATLKMTQYVEKCKSQGCGKEGLKNLATGFGLVAGGVLLCYIAKKAVDVCMYLVIKKIDKDCFAMKEEYKRNMFAANENKKQETNQKKAELQMKVADHRAEIHRQEKAEKQTKEDPKLEVWLEKYRQTMRQSSHRNCKERDLIFPWLREGYDTGLLAPTDCGKTTFMMQVAIALSKGKCSYPIAPQCEIIKPIPTLVFSLEQSKREIDTNYGEICNALPLLTIYAGTENTPTKILERIQQEMMADRGCGLVVIIDNFTKLQEFSGLKEMEWFCLILDKLRHASLEAGKPLTPIKVFHAKKGCKVNRRFDESYFRGDGKYLFDAHNVLYLTYCNQGNDKRILGFIKRKNGDKRQLWMLQYANTHPYQYNYVGPAKEKDMGMPSDKEEPKKKTRGREEKISIEKCVYYYNQHKIEKCSISEIEKEAGVPWNTIYTRLKRDGYLKPQQRKPNEEKGKS